MRIGKRTRRAVPVAVTAAGLTTAVSLLPVESPNSGARIWASSLSTAERIEYSQPDRFSGLPVEYRRALFQTDSTAEGRAKFWQGVLQRYQKAHTLTVAQSQLLGRVGSTLTPEFFQSRVGDAQSGRIAAMRRDVATSLGASAEKELFLTAGPLGAASSLSWLERVRYAWRSHRPKAIVAFANYVAPGLLAWDCNCAESNDCSGGTRCGYSPYSCSATTWGCGAFYWGSCSALCSYDGQS
jgi:hypothetical protein